MTEYHTLTLHLQVGETRYSLEIKTDNTKLLEAYRENPQRVEKIFTGQLILAEGNLHLDEGLDDAVNKIMRRATLDLISLVRELPTEH